MEIRFAVKRKSFSKYQLKEHRGNFTIYKLYFAGDYTKNKGRVLLAAETGLEIADQIIIDKN